MGRLFRILLLSIGLASCQFQEEDYDALEIKVVDQQFHASGVIDGTTPDTIQAAIAKHPTIKTVVLQWVPGSVDDEANLAAGRIVRHAGLTTIVPEKGSVSSGGIDLFLSGVRRVIGPGACIGVHSWSYMDNRGNLIQGRDVPEEDEEHRLYLDYYLDMEIPSEFYWYTLEAADSEEMHWMIPADFKRFAMTTGPVSDIAADADWCDAHDENNAPRQNHVADCPDVMFDRTARIFDAVTICGTPDIPQEKLAYAAAVMAQWIDNDMDGQADNPPVVRALAKNKATVIMTAEELPLYKSIPLETYWLISGIMIQDLYAYETNPTKGRDASQEETHHLYLNYGLAHAFPNIFDDQSYESEIHAVWRIADQKGYYAYDDPTCDVACKVSEFLYKATAAYFASLPDLDDDEFTLRSRDALRDNLPEVMDIFESDRYDYPTIMWPDGTYPYQEHIVLDFKRPQKNSS